MSDELKDVRIKYEIANNLKKEDRLTKKDLENAEKIIKARKKYIKKDEPPKMGNPAIVKTYEDARENAMINRDIPAMNKGGDVTVGKGGDYIKDLID